MIDNAQGKKTPEEVFEEISMLLHAVENATASGQESIYSKAALLAKNCGVPVYKLLASALFPTIERELDAEIGNRSHYISIVFGKIGEASLPTLIPMLPKSQWAHYALGYIGTEKAVDFLLKELRSTNWRRVAAAATGIGISKNKGALPELRAIYADLPIRMPIGEVSVACKQAIDKIESIFNLEKTDGNAEAKKTKCKPAQVFIPSAYAHSWQSFRDYPSLFRGEWGINYQAGIAVVVTTLLSDTIYRITNMVQVFGRLSWERGMLPNVYTMIYAICIGFLFTVINRFVRETDSLPLYWGLAVVIFNELWNVLNGHPATGGMLWYIRLEVYVSEFLLIVGLISAIRKWGATCMSLILGAVLSLLPVLIADLIFIERGNFNMVSIAGGITNRVILALLLFYSFKRYFEIGCNSARQAKVP